MHSTSLIFNFLFSAIMIICATRARSALITTSLLVPLCTFIFFESSPNVLSLRFVILSWNFILGGLDSSLSLLKSYTPSLPKPLPEADLFSISGVASLPVDRQTRSCCSPLKGLIQLRSSTDINDFTSSSSLAIRLAWRLVRWKVVGVPR